MKWKNEAVPLGTEKPADPAWKQKAVPINDESGATQPSLQPEPDQAPSMNMARGAVERGGDLLGGLFTAADAVADWAEEKYPLGGLVWEDGIIPDYKGPDEYAQWRAESGGEEPLKTAADRWKNLDVGYVENHTWDKVKQEFSEGGALSGSAWAEVMAYGAEQGVKSIPDMVAAMTVLPTYVMARSGEIGEERAKNKGKEEADLTDVLEAAPAALGSAILERIGAKGITEAGAEAIGKEALQQGLGRLAKEGAKAGSKEAATEFVQEGIIEYLGEKFGTGAAMSVWEALDRGAAGAVAGGVYGTGAGIGGAAVNQVRNRKQGTGAPADEAAPPVVQDEVQGETLAPTDDNAPVNDYPGRPEWASEQTNIFRDGTQPESSEASPNIESQAQTELSQKTQSQEPANAAQTSDEVLESQAPEDASPEPMPAQQDDVASPELPDGDFEQGSGAQEDAAITLPEADQDVIQRKFGSSDKRPQAIQAFSNVKPDTANRREALAMDIEINGDRGDLAAPRVEILDGLRQSLNASKPLRSKLSDQFPSAEQRELIPSVSATSSRSLNILSEAISDPAFNKFVDSAAQRLRDGEARSDVIRELRKELMSNEEGSRAFVASEPADPVQKESTSTPLEQGENLPEEQMSVDEGGFDAVTPSEPSIAAEQEVEAATLPQEDVETVVSTPTSRKVDQAATDTDINPTEAQKEAGNYRKAKVRIQGLDVSIENPKGSTRSGTDPDGNRWESTMAHHYGDIKGTKAADGDNLDVFIGPYPEIDQVFVIDQPNADGSFDESKVMLGFANEKDAREGYLANYEDGWTVGPITRMTTDELKAWIKDGDTTKPASERQGATSDQASATVTDTQSESALSREAGYRRTPEYQQETLTVQEAESIRDELMNGWKGAPDVIIRDRVSEFPPGLQAAIRLANAENDMRGVFWNDTVYILASRIPDRMRMEQVILHEVIGHYGLRKMLGKDMERVLNQIWLSHGGQKRADFIIKRYFPGNSFDVNNKEHRHTVAEELIAHLAEQKRGQTLVQRAVAIIREGLRKLGFTIEFTVDDIVNLLRKARATVENGGFETVGNFSGNESPASRFSRLIKDLSETQTTKNGESTRLKNPVYLSDGSRLSGFTDPQEQKVFYGYDQTGEPFTVPRSRIRPDEITTSRDGNRTATAIKEGLLSLQAVSSQSGRNRGSKDELSSGDGVFDETHADTSADSEGADRDGERIDAARAEISSDSTDGVIPPNFRFSRAGVPDLDPQPFGPPSDTLVRKAVQKCADRFTVLKDVQHQISKSSGELPESSDAYRAEELFHGKVENDIRLIRENMIEPLAKQMSEYGISLKQLDEFLYALHAPERNRVIAERNPEMPDGGSGMTNQEAAEIINRVEKNGDLDRYRELAGKVHAMLDRRRGILRTSGLLDEDTVGAWEASYKFYVPLKGFAADERPDGLPRAGKGFSIAGKESQMAGGRRSKAASPTANAISDLSEAVLRHRKNEVGNAFLNLVNMYPNPDYWRVFTDENPEVERKPVRVKDPVTGKMKIEVREQTVPMAMMSDRYFTTKVNGKTAYIKIEDQRLMRAMQNMGPDTNNIIVQSLAVVTRLMSSLNTSYNPEFVISNFARDIQTALLNLTSEQSSEDGKARGKKIAIKTLKETGPAIRAIHASLRGKSLEGRSGELQRYFDQFRADGAKTGWFDMKDIDGQMQDMEKLVEMARGGPISLSGLRRGFRWTTEMVENGNSAIENGVRLSAYVNAIEAGIPRSQAASLAKNMTVNFNRRGEWGTTINAFYMFANASIQGTANFIRTLGRLNGTKTDPIWRRLNTAQKIAAGISVGSFMLSLLNRLVAGEDDDEVNWWDKVPDYVKERNIVIMKSLHGGEPGEYWTIPTPYGYNIFNVLGAQLEHVAFSDSQSAGDAASNVVLAALGSFSPIGFEESQEAYGVVAKNIMPTILRPVASLSLNENFMGSPIYKENFPFGTPSPDSSLSFRSTPDMFKILAEDLNELTGGNKQMSGAVDISPDVMQFLVGYYGGGAYDFFTSRAPNAAMKWAQGVEMESREIPFWRKLNGRVLPYEDQSIFYNRRDEIRQIEKRAESLKGRERAQFRRDYWDMLRLGPTMDLTERRLKTLRKERDRIEMREGLSAAEKDQRLQKVEDRMKREFDRFNRLYNEATADE